LLDSLLQENLVIFFNMTDVKFEVGEPCFAKVKGYPAWPAEVTATEGGKFEVFFFGTHETARLTVKDLFKVNETSIDKFSQPKMKARKWFKEGLDEMMTLVQTRKNKPIKAPGSKTPAGNKTISITTPTKIPAIRSKDNQEDSSLSPVVLLDTRAVEKANSVKSGGGTSRNKSKMPSPVKKSNINTASIKMPTMYAPYQSNTQESLEAGDPYRRVVGPIVTPSRRQLEDARKEAAKSPVVEDESPNKSPVTGKGSKRHSKASTSINKKQRTDEPIKMSININLEMSAETFLRVARELPGLLNLSADQINTGVNIEN